MAVRRQQYLIDQLHLVARGSTFQDSREPPLRVGDWVRLNSGGPACLVVDFNGDEFAVSWRDRKGAGYDALFPRLCLGRLCLSSI